jgi:hypothetical protein
MRFPSRPVEAVEVLEELREERGPVGLDPRAQAVEDGRVARPRDCPRPRASAGVIERLNATRDTREVPYAAG